MTRKLFISTLIAIAAAFALTVPRPAGELLINTPSGPKKLSQYKGKVVVLGLILTTCEHCQATTKVLNRIQTDYAGKGVQILEAAFNEEAAGALPMFIRQYSPTFPVGAIDVNTAVSFSQVTPEMKPTAPIVFFIDRTGVIRSQHLGNSPVLQGDSNQKIRAEIDKLLK